MCTASDDSKMLTRGTAPRPQRLLKKRLGELVDGKLQATAIQKTRFTELGEMLRNDYQMNARRSLKRAERSISHLNEFFGQDRAITITSDLGLCCLPQEGGSRECHHQPGARSAPPNVSTRKARRQDRRACRTAPSNSTDCTTATLRVRDVICHVNDSSLDRLTAFVLKLARSNRHVGVDGVFRCFGAAGGS